MVLQLQVWAFWFFQEAGIAFDPRAMWNQMGWLARMVVVRLAEQAAGTYVPQAGERVGELIELGRRGGRRELHLGGQAGAVIEGGVLEVVRLPARAPRGRRDARD